MMKLVRYAIADQGPVENQSGEFVRLSEVKALVEKLSMMQLGFGGVGSNDMKPFVKAGVVLEVYDRDFTIANNIRKSFVEVNS